MHSSSCCVPGKSRRSVILLAWSGVGPYVRLCQVNRLGDHRRGSHEEGPSLVEGNPSHLGRAGLVLGRRWWAPPRLPPRRPRRPPRLLPRRLRRLVPPPPLPPLRSVR